MSVFGNLITFCTGVWTLKKKCQRYSWQFSKPSLSSTPKDHQSGQGSRSRIKSLAAEWHQAKGFSLFPLPNMSQEHVREKALHLRGGERKEPRKGDGERHQQISGVDEKHLQWKALRRALTFKRMCRGVFTVTVALLPAQHSKFKSYIRSHLSNCLSLKRNPQKSPSQAFLVLYGVKKGFVATRESPPPPPPPLPLFLPSQLRHSLLVSVITVPLVALHIIYLLIPINCCRACVET